MKLLRFNANTQEYRAIRVYLSQNIDKLCTGPTDSVSKSYIMNGSLVNASFILVVAPNVNRKTRSGNKHVDLESIKGFLVGQIRTNDIYIDVVCGTGYGTMLMKFARQIAIENNKLFLRLSGLPGPMMAYYNYKLPESFIFSEKSCKQIDKIEYLASQVKVLYKQGKLIKSSKAKDDLIKLLIKNKLTSDKTCKTKSECDTNGYSMLLCINN